MRSELVHQATKKIENRFLLATSVIKATRKLHTNSTRPEDTINQVLNEVISGTRIHGDLPKVAPPPIIELLLEPDA